jgi:serine/threonine-protein kinase
MADDSLREHRVDDRFAEVLAELLQAEEQGLTPHLERYLASFPDLEPRLRAYFSNRERFKRLTEHLAPASPLGLGTGTDGASVPSALRPGMRFGGFEVLEELGHGGRGVVYRVSDLELNRPLAVKVLRPELRDQPDSVRRFLEEAQLTSQLQHPGIVPVHAIGRLADGPPYFAMKLVQGRTLAALLSERTSPAHDLPRYLGIFDQVCQAVAYAHSRGVIHRDLKPSNIMVGAFAEVQVMDWGLAKVLPAAVPSQGLSQGAPEALTRGGADTVRTLRTETAGLSSADGLVVGTFAYMAPEQAKGQVEELDPRADVFGLGAVLCEVLTGLPPYTGAPAWELHLKASAGDLAEAFARLDRCGADAELIVLARDCLAPERERRPREAGAVAERLATYLTEVQQRLRRAELEGAAAQARMEEARATARAERRSRRLTIGLGTAVVLLLGVGGGGAWWLQQQQQTRAAEAALRRQRADSEVTLALADARLLREQAMRAPLGGSGRFREALAAAHNAFVQAETGEASPELRQQAADLVAELGREAEAAERDRRLLSRLLEVVGPQDGPSVARSDGGQIMQMDEPNFGEQFASAFRDWGLDVDATPTAVAAARLKTRPVAVVTEVAAALEAWAGERQLRKKPQAAWQRLADLLTALDDQPGPRLRELHALLARNRLPVERALGELSGALMPFAALGGVVPGNDRNRLRRLAVETDPSSEPVLGLVVLARALWLAGDDAVAVQLLREAVQVRPGEAVLHHTLGKLLEVQRPPRWREAVECYAAVRALRPEVGVPLANTLVNSGRVDEGLGLWKHLVKARPDNPWMHSQYGQTLGNLSRYKEAEAEFREAIHLKPDNPMAHYNLGVTLSAGERFKEAEAEYREAIRLKPDYQHAHINLGAVLIYQSRYKEAEKVCRDAAFLWPDEPANDSNLGYALNKQGLYKEAEEVCREAIQRNPGYSSAYVNLGNALSKQRLYEKAETAYREAIRLTPADPTAHHDLGNDLLDLHRYEEAEAEFRETIRLQPDGYKGYSSLAIALGNQGRDKEAEAACRAALDRNPKDHKTYSNLGNTLVPQGRYEEAVAAYRAAIDLKPDDYTAQYNLGFAMQNSGRFRDAQAACRELLRIAPPHEPIRRTAEGLLRQCERLFELDCKLQALLRGEPEPADVTERLDLAAFCQQPYKGLYATAARLYATSFADDPKLADDIRRSHRYQAAQCAILAAAGQGADSPKPGDKERTRLRSQALDWLRADLGLSQKLAETGNVGGRAQVQRVLQAWQNNLWFTSVRDKEWLAKLLDPERIAWEEFWTDVEALRKRIHQTK